MGLAGTAGGNDPLLFGIMIIGLLFIGVGVAGLGGPA